MNLNFLNFIDIKILAFARQNSQEKLDLRDFLVFVDGFYKVLADFSLPGTIRPVVRLSVRRIIFYLHPNLSHQEVKTTRKLLSQW